MSTSTIEPYQWVNRELVSTFEWDRSPDVAFELSAQINRDHVPALNTPGSCQADHWTGPAMNEFRRHALACLGHFDDHGRLMTYAVISRHDRTAPETYWAPGYPHTHGYVNRSLVHYVDPGAGAPLVIWGGHLPEPVVIRPRAGLTVVFDGKLHHGFHNWDGPPRVTMVVQSVPDNLVTEGEI